MDNIIYDIKLDLPASMTFQPMQLTTLWPKADDFPADANNDFSAKRLFSCCKQNNNAGHAEKTRKHTQLVTFV